MLVLLTLAVVAQVCCVRLFLHVCFFGLEKNGYPPRGSFRVVDDKGRRPPAQDSVPSIYVVVVVVHVANGSSALLPFRRVPGGLAVRRFGIASAPAGVPGTHSWRSLGM